MTPVTGGGSRFPVLDRHGVQIKVGDQLRAQVCVGRYGQTRIIETTVTEDHWPLCSLYVAGGPYGGYSINSHFDFDGRVLRCYHQHRDFEHGHEQWAEVIK